MTGDEITDGRGRESSVKPDHWYTARDGVWAGPFRFGVLVELARARVLCSDDLVWSLHTECWVHAAAIPGLFRPRHSADAAGRGTLTPSTSATPTVFLWGGLAWVIAVWTLIAIIRLDALEFRNMLMETRIEVFGSIFLTALAVYLLPRVWNACESWQRDGGRGALSPELFACFSD